MLFEMQIHYFASAFEVTLLDYCIKSSKATFHLLFTSKSANTVTQIRIHIFKITERLLVATTRKMNQK